MRKYKSTAVLDKPQEPAPASENVDANHAGFVQKKQRFSWRQAVLTGVSAIAVLAGTLTLVPHLRDLTGSHGAQGASSRPIASRSLQLRTKPISKLPEEEVRRMVKEGSFFHQAWNALSKGVRHDYEVMILHGDTLVVDAATNLMWQQAGSPSLIAYEQADAYVQKLNASAHGGFGDWRLPTIEEAFSLLEEKESRGDLCLDPIFSRQRWAIWTADKESKREAWVISFDRGDCNDYDANYVFYVRAVRSMNAAE